MLYTDHEVQLYLLYGSQNRVTISVRSINTMVFMTEAEFFLARYERTLSMFHIHENWGALDKKAFPLTHSV